VLFMLVVFAELCAGASIREPEDLSPQATSRSIALRCGWRPNRDEGEDSPYSHLAGPSWLV